MSQKSKYLLPILLITNTSCHSEELLLPQFPVPIDEIEDNNKERPLLLSGCYVSDRISSTFDSRRGYSCNARWTSNSLPLFLYLETPGMEEELEWAVGYMNTIIGVKVFSLEDLGGYQVIVSYKENLSEETRIGEANWSISNFEIDKATMGIKKSLSKESKQQVLLHELGHLLGLHHDDGCSIMQSVLDLNCNKFSDFDIFSLKLLYGNSSDLFFDTNVISNLKMGLMAEGVNSDHDRKNFCNIK